jgi:hypothetical protein
MPEKFPKKGPDGNKMDYSGTAFPKPVKKKTKKTSRGK